MAIEEALRDTLMDGYEEAEEGLQVLFYQFITYMLTPLVATGTLNSILALDFDKWSRSDEFMDKVAG